jgi:hypothetical protein
MHAKISPQSQSCKLHLDYHKNKLFLAIFLQYRIIVTLSPTLFFVHRENSLVCAYLQCLLAQNTFIRSPQVSWSGAHPRRGGGGCRAATAPNLPKPKFKNHGVCRHGDIKSFTKFTHQPKSATEVG